MIQIPKTKNNNFVNLYLEIENSSTITSEQAIYTKEPPAKQAHTSSIMSEPSYLRAIPNRTPNGVKIANRQIIPVTNLSSPGKAWAMDIPKAIPAAPLCMTIANAKSKTSLASPEILRASPSKTA